MPLTTIGTIRIDPRERRTIFFPETSFNSKKYLIVSLEVVPVTTLAEFFSLEVVPTIKNADGMFQRPSVCVFQPEGIPLLMKISNLDGGKTTDTLQIGVKPVGKYVSRFRPSQLVLLLKKSSENSDTRLIVT